MTEDKEWREDQRTSAGSLDNRHIWEIEKGIKKKWRKELEAVAREVEVSENGKS